MSQSQSIQAACGGGIALSFGYEMKLHKCVAFTGYGRFSPGTNRALEHGMQPNNTISKCVHSLRNDNRRFEGENMSTSTSATNSIQCLKTQRKTGQKLTKMKWSISPERKKVIYRCQSVFARGASQSRWANKGRGRAFGLVVIAVAGTSSHSVDLLTSTVYGTELRITSKWQPPTAPRQMTHIAYE